jgi:RTX calcium-binding nonapeptide repeat (4 copies)
MSSLFGIKFGIIGSFIAVLFLVGIYSSAITALGKSEAFSLGSTLGNLGNDLANSIAGMVKQKTGEGCNGSGDQSSRITSQSSSTTSGSSSMMSSSSSSGNGQTIVSSSNGEGKSIICGGPGIDILSGGSGDDIIYGGKGNDKLFGNGGDDVLVGGVGRDYFDCGPGKDTIRDFNPSEGDTKTTDCEIVLNSHNSEHGGLTHSQSSIGSHIPHAQPTATSPETTIGNSSPQTSILKSHNPIVPAGSVGKTVKEPSNLVQKTGSMKSLTLLALNKSKSSSQNLTTSNTARNVTLSRGINSVGTVYHSNNSTNPAGIDPRKSNTTQSSQRPVLISSGLASPISHNILPVLSIKKGQQVLWSNPSTVPDPQTVTFAPDKKFVASLFIPLLVSNSTQLKTLIPGENSMPILLPQHGKQTTLLTLNSRAIEPVAIDQNGLVKKIIQKNSTGSYTALGTEKYINSGWLLPKGQEKGYPGALTGFKVTFAKAGVYRYSDMFHPWINGTIRVN